MRILLVEDDVMLGGSLKKALELSGYSVEWVQDGEAAELTVETSQFSLIILDMNLPIISGFDFLKNLRKQADQTPVLILTAMDNMSSRVKGLDLGADDYITKPFDLDELLARIRALIRRSKGSAEPTIKCGDVELNLSAKTITYKDSVVLLPAKEYKLLAHLMSSPGKIFSKAQIEEIIYGIDEEFESNTVEVLVYKLRKKFGDNFIKTMRGMGYMVAKEGAKGQ